VPSAKDRLALAMSSCPEPFNGGIRRSHQAGRCERRAIEKRGALVTGCANRACSARRVDAATTVSSNARTVPGGIQHAAIRRLATGHLAAGHFNQGAGHEALLLDAAGTVAGANSSGWTRRPKANFTNRSFQSVFWHEWLEWPVSRPGLNHQLTGRW
jgi:hypothetical protein